MTTTNTATLPAHTLPYFHLMRGPAFRCATYAITATTGTMTCARYTAERANPDGSCGIPSN